MQLLNKSPKESSGITCEVFGWAEKGGPQEAIGTLQIKIIQSEIPILVVLKVKKNGLRKEAVVKMWRKRKILFKRITTQEGDDAFECKSGSIS